MINKKKIKNIMIGVLVSCITLQAMIPSNMVAKTNQEAPITSLTSVENEEQIAVKGNELTLLKTEGKKGQWRIEPVDKVFCTIKNEQNDKLMQIEQGADGEWTVSLEQKEVLEDEQLWYVEICDEDTYRIKSKANDMCLQIEKDDDDKFSFSLGEEMEEDTQLWEMNEKSYDYANQYFTYLEEQNPELVSRKEQIKIEKLQDKRLQLYQNYEANQKEIQEIDRELETLGVVELTAEQVAEKIGKENEEMSPNARIATFPTADGVVWSSSRVYEVCRGKVIELQILVGSPVYGSSASTSALVASIDKTFHAADFKAGNRNLLKVTMENLVVNGVEKIPVVGEILGVGVTVFSWLSSYMSDLSTSTVIENIEVDYTIAQFGETKLVYAKYQGFEDDLQVLAYMGNKSNMTISVDKPLVYVGNTYPEIEKTTYTDSIASPEYASGFKAYAAQLYYNYKNNLSEMDECLLVYKYKLTVIDGNDYYISIPVYY